MKTLHWAGRALVRISNIGLFTNEVTFTTNDTWVVPDVHGDGRPVEVEMSAYGPGGGGGGGSRVSALCNPSSEGYAGGVGGTGSRATSFRTLPVGTIVTFTVGGPGTGGAGGLWDVTFPDDPGQCGPLPQAGATGGTVRIQISGVTVAEAYGGGGGGGAQRATGTRGADGGGVADFVTTGQGAAGGIGGGIQQTGQTGAAGRVVIEY